MKTAILFEKENEYTGKIIKAFEAKNLKAEFIDIGKVGLFVEKNSSSIVFDSAPFDFEAVFLQASNEFTVFVEPLLSEFVDSGIYCQLKPGAFYIVSNRPFTYTTLNNKGINICKTQIVADKESLEGSLKQLSFPLHLKFFSSNKKVQGFVADSEKNFKSVLKNTSFEVDAITVQEFIEGDLNQNLVIGDEVFTIKRKWIDKDLSHSKKAISSKPHEEEHELAIKATKVVGADIATVKIINGTVVNVRSLIDLELYHRTLGVNVFDRLAEFYKEKLSGE